MPFASLWSFVTNVIYHLIRRFASTLVWSYFRQNFLHLCFANQEHWNEPIEMKWKNNIALFCYMSESMHHSRTLRTRPSKECWRVWWHFEEQRLFVVTWLIVIMKLPSAISKDDDDHEECHSRSSVEKNKILVDLIIAFPIQTSTQLFFLLSFIETTFEIQKKKNKRREW